MWNRLVTLSIDDREGMEGGGEGTTDKEANRGRGWLSIVDMTVDWRGSNWFVIVFCGIFRQKIRRGQNSGCQCAYIQY